MISRDLEPTTAPLQALLPSTPYLLAYALPLLILSCLLTFSGCFLTLDRTRTFAPRSDAGYEATLGAPNRFLKRHRMGWLARIPFRGGFGGLGAGYLFGLQLTTFLSLLIPAVTASPALSRQSFAAVWVLSSISTAVLAGRWRVLALLFIGLSGGTAFAIALCVITHPALVTRIVICAISASFFVIGTLLPIARTQHGFTRLCAASMGSFGVVVSIALLAHSPAWANVWTRLWIKDGENWGTTAAERGLSAAFVMLLIAGTACDWFLHRKFGENPDERWDAYLADYTANLPNAPGRTGVFRPFPSLFSGLWKHKSSTPHPTSIPLFSSDTKDVPESPVAEVKGSGGGEASPSPPYQVPRLRKAASNPLSPKPPPFLMSKQPTFLKKRSMQAHIPGQRGGRELVRFRAAEELSSSSDSDSDSGPATPGVPRSSSGGSTSSATVVASPTSAPRVVKARQGGKSEAVLYSDYDDERVSGDIKTASLPKRGEPGWSPSFIRKASIARTTSLSVPSTTSGLTTPGDVKGSMANENGSTTPASALPSPLSPASASSKASLDSPLRAVPATPSLIRAIDRLARAQGDAYGFPAPSSPSTPGTPVVVDEKDREERGERWAHFWKDVKERAAIPAYPSRPFDDKTHDHS